MAELIRLSLSARRAWIEIKWGIMSTDMQSVDRNWCPRIYFGRVDKSLSARRAWIEIFDGVPKISDFGVALRKESVDRNVMGVAIRSATSVALRKESVDRNVAAPGAMLIGALSLSARRAWIEMRSVMQP